VLDRGFGVEASLGIEFVSLLEMVEPLLKIGPFDPCCWQVGNSLPVQSEVAEPIAVSSSLIVSPQAPVPLNPFEEVIEKLRTS
jgi:hypothetical protein